MKNFIVKIAFIFSASATMAQTAIIGKLVDEKTGEPLLFANAGIAGTSIGTISDFEGNFTLQSSSITTGTYAVQISFVSYQTKIIEGVQVVEGQTTNLGDVKMASSAEELEAVQINAKADVRSENVLMMEQKNADMISQTIGTKELSRKGVSDVAAGLTKMTGVSLSSGNPQLFVRGMGDRYNSAQLNGMPIASPNPELKVIPLDIFSTDVVDNISMNKVFVTEKYADYAGALIDIKTKSFIEESYVKAEINTEYNTQSTGKLFKQGDGGANDFFGYDDGTRSLNSTIAGTKFYNPGKGEQAEEPFKTTFAVNESEAPMNVGGKIMGGLVHKKLSLIGTVSFNNDYNTYNGVYKVLNSQYQPRIDYDYTSYVYSTNMSSLANLTYEFNKKNKVQYVFLFLNTSSNDLSEYSGYNRDQGQDFFIRRMTFRQHALTNHQLIGDHQIFKQLSFDWAGSYSEAKSAEPDRKELVYMETGNGYIFNTIDRINNNRFWSSIDEKEISGRAGFKYEFAENETNKYKGKIKFGGNLRMKDREFNARQFYYNLDQSFNGQVVDPMHPEDNINDANFNSGLISVGEQPNPSYIYSASLNVFALYANVDYDLGKTLQVGLGMRFESSEQIVNYKKLSDTYSGPFRKAKLESNDLYPNLYAKLKINDRSNFRLAGSKTISRPEFKEMAPFLYEEVFGGMQIQGNADLQNAYNYNVDLKYELFPNTGEITALTVFGRYLENPIERIVESSSSKLYSFQNAKSAFVYGVEFEINKKMSTFTDSKVLAPVSIGFNTSLLYSKIELSQTGSTVNTNQNRQLQGASPYLVNADLNYEIKYNEIATTMITLTYNVFGPRIYSVGTLGANDIYEKPVNTIDLMVKNQIIKNLYANLTFRNILNQQVIRQQEGNGEQLVVNSKQLGSKIGLTLSYQF